MPIALSTISNGMDQVTRKMTQGTRNVPPYSDRMRGKRQMLPVPIAIPSAARIRP